MIRGTGSAGRFDIYKPVKVLWFGYMEKVGCNGDDLILNPLLNFEPMKGLKHREDMTMFGRLFGSECLTTKLLCSMKTSKRTISIILGRRKAC